MSFFVSDSIKDIIDKDSVGSNRELGPSEFFFGIAGYLEDKEINIPMTSIRIIGNNQVEVKIKSNLSLLENLFFKKLKISEIIIGRNSLSTENLLFSCAEEKTDNYETTVILQVKEGLNV